MKRKKYIIAVLIAISVFILLYFSIMYSKDTPAVADNEYVLHEVITLDPLVFRGSVVASEMQNVQYDGSLGEIESIHVQKGQQVNVGDELVTYKNNVINEEIAMKKLSRERLNFNITNVQNEINTTNTKIKETENKLTTKRNDLNNLNYDDPDNFLIAEQITQEISQLEMELEAQRQALPSLRQTLEGFNFDLKELNVSITQSEQNVIFKVTSTVDGVVAERNDNISDPSMPLLQILSNDVIIEGIVSEFDYHRLEQQQRVTIKPNSSSEVIGGEITKIGLTPLVEAGAEGTVNYAFTITPEQVLHYGLSVQVFLEQTNIIVPETAIVFEGTDAYVFVYSDGRVSKQKIIVIEVNNQINVTEGITVGETIIENPDQEIRDGQEVNFDD